MTLVFDFGGVVFRWHPPSFLARVWPHRCPDEAAGARAAEAFFTQYGGDWGAFDQGLIDAPTVIARIAARTGWPVSEVAAVVDAVPQELQPIAGTVQLIAELKAAGHQLGYLSNMPEPYADYLERAYPLAQWFEGGVFSSRVKHSKPNAEVFALTKQCLKARPDEIVFIDDHPANIAAAEGQGWGAELFTTPERLRERLQARGLLG